MTRVRLTSLARITPEELDAIEARATELDCSVGAIWNSKHRWCAGASKDGEYLPTLRGFSSTYDALTAALDAFEAQERDRLSDRYTSDELVTIYNATGGEVARA